ncbi:hypothetical protein C8Q80DRAFT_1217334 [Daedaleopsis nitida]|nr:hypothetical protein C8Q80DRAFT_1217334 [Daedaleopsis nitida]
MAELRVVVHIWHLTCQSRLHQNRAGQTSTFLLLTPHDSSTPVLLRMRVYWYLAFIFALAMVRAACNGCGKSFERLPQHQVTCKMARNLYTNLRQHVDNRSLVRQAAANKLRQDTEQRQAATAQKECEEANERARQEVLTQPEFDKDELTGFSVDRENRCLDEFSTTPSRSFNKNDGWREASVELSMPKEKHKHESEATAPVFTVPGIWVRNFTTLIRDACKDAISHRYHWVPFKLFHRSPSSTASTTSTSEEQLYSKVYNCNTMNIEHEAIQAAPRDPGDSDDIEYVVAPILVYSDSTHLTNFGTASLWPIYIWLGTLTKYLHIKPSMFAAHHLAYITTLSATTIHQAYVEAYGEPPSAAILRLLKQDLMQHIWLLLLDTDFMHAVRHSMLVKCGDGIIQRIFPRIFTYMADYPENCLVACLKQLANCPCPDCLVQKHEIVEMGTQRELDRRTQRACQDNEHTQSWINTVSRAPITCHASLTLPLQSAFSIRFAEFGRRVYDLFVPDLMHEFELGVWKSTFTHLVRILIAAGGNVVQTLDERFAMVPTFVRRTIRQFGHNVSAMKKLAARDFEQMLQCAIPVFKRLLPDQANNIVLDMLFRLAMWHALAKLRLHSGSTLDTFDIATRALGIAMRAFLKKVCPLYTTKELPKETQHRQARQTRARTASGTANQVFNLVTYKFHHLGDYGELKHWRVKGFYARTNKNAKMAGQIAQHIRRQQVLHKIAGKPPSHKHPRKERRPLRKHIYQRNHLSTNTPANPACDNFVICLKSHLLRRLPGGDTLANDYDPNQDSVNPSTHPDIIMYSPHPDCHPFLYARILGIFHVNVYRSGTDLGGADDSPLQREHVLWVRWFDVDSSAPGGFARCRLHQLRWAKDDDHAYGFVAPEDVLHAAHLIPVFANGTQPVHGVSTEEWRHHYVNFFVDHNMTSQPIVDMVAEDPLELDDDGHDDQGQCSGEAPGDEEDELMDYGYVSSDYGEEDDEYEQLSDIDLVADVEDEGPDIDDTLLDATGFNMY